MSAGRKAGMASSLPVTVPCASHSLFSVLHWMTHASITPKHDAWTTVGGGHVYADTRRYYYSGAIHFGFCFIWYSFFQWSGLQQLGRLSCLTREPQGSFSLHLPSPGISSTNHHIQFYLFGLWGSNWAPQASKQVKLLNNLSSEPQDYS